MVQLPLEDLLEDTREGSHKVAVAAAGEVLAVGDLIAEECRQVEMLLLRALSDLDTSPTRLLIKSPSALKISETLACPDMLAQEL